MKYRSFTIRPGWHSFGWPVAFENEHREFRPARSIWQAQRAIDSNIEMLAGDPDKFPALPAGVVGQNEEHRLTGRDLL